MEQALADAHIKQLSYTRSVFQVISYFDIFGFPLKAEEIKKFCGEKINEEQLQISLEELLLKNNIRRHKEYFLLEGSSERLVEKRKEREVNLTQKLARIKKYAGLISKFPFVESVFISGSVSKGILDETGDVDYFIISKPGRVWLCRSMLILFKKIFLLNSRKYFCVNYFIDSANLTIPDKNLFVATELITLLPVSENLISEQFRKSNQWALSVFPNSQMQLEPLVKDSLKKPVPSRWMEKIAHGKLGEVMDNFFFEKTLSRWKRKFPHFNRDEFDLNMRSYKNVSKHHPQGHQLKVLNALEERMKKFGEACVS